MKTGVKSIPLTLVDVKYMQERVIFNCSKAKVHLNSIDILVDIYISLSENEKLITLIALLWKTQTISILTQLS